MNVIFLILVVVAGLLALLDVVLGYRGGDGRRFALTPFAVMLLALALLLQGAGVA